MIIRTKHPSIYTGIATILATVFAMALTDAFVKYTSAGMPLWQIYVLRSLIVIPVLLVFTRRNIWPRAFTWVLLRSLALVLMYLAIYAAIPVLSLSVIAATLYTGPLFITVFSALFLKEQIRGLHWFAVFVGFAGMMMMIQPTASDFSSLSLIPVAAAVLYAFATVLTRAKCTRIPAMTLALWLNVMLLLFGAIASMIIALSNLDTIYDYPFLFGKWNELGRDEWLITVILALLIIGVSIGLAKAYQSPSPQVIATFDYAYLIFAAFWGYVFFSEIPGFWTIIGMISIAGAGLISLSATKQKS